LTFKKYFAKLVSVVMGSAVTAQDGLMTPGGYSCLRPRGGRVIIKNDGKELTVDEDHYPVRRLLQFYPFPIGQDGVYPNLSLQPYLNKSLPDGTRYLFLCGHPCLFQAGFKDRKATLEMKG
jgi:hypothetical protein